jgi:hypothetical protein
LNNCRQLGDMQKGLQCKKSCSVRVGSQGAS